MARDPTRRTDTTHRRTRRCVDHGVAQQIVDHLAQAGGVTGDEHVPMTPSEIGRPGSTARAASTASRHHAAEVDGGPVQRPALVEPGQQQQVVDQHPHP